jgi:hypothetical protein
VTVARPSRDSGGVAPRTTAEPGRGHKAFARLVGAVGLVALTALLYWMLTDESFTVSEGNVTFRGLAHAEETEVRDLLSDIDRRPNVFRVRASEIVADLSTLTEVDAASAVVTLPANISVTLDERDPVFIWSDDAQSWLVDEEGMLFAPADLEGGGEQPGDGAGEDGAGEDGARERLPVVVDARLPEEPPTEGTYLSPLDLAAMRQLLALDAELLGSRAQDLALRVDDAHGYVLEGRDAGWRALFGHYTPNLQPPGVIPAQVQCLKWLLDRREPRLEQVRLAVSDDACGTFTLVGDGPAEGD